MKCIEDEIPFELPDGWAWSRLGAVAEAIGDGDHQPPPQTSFGVPFLVISNVSGGRLSFENTRFVSKEYFSQLPETRKPRNGDLLFTVTGSYGIPVLVDSDDKFCFQRHIAIVRPCIISNRYLYVILGSSYIKSICDAIGTGKLCEITNDKNCNFVLWVGNKRLIKKRLFDKFIEQAYSI